MNLGESAKVVKVITAINHTVGFFIGFWDGAKRPTDLKICLGKNSFYNTYVLC